MQQNLEQIQQIPLYICTVANLAAVEAAQVQDPALRSDLESLLLCLAATSAKLERVIHDALAKPRVRRLLADRVPSNLAPLRRTALSMAHGRLSAMTAPPCTPEQEEPRQRDAPQ